ncbi:type III-B CRISPR module RAMP protein Cmr4 [Porphyromonas sp.]|uniref:type III-B CRISPR module RAMP protein Cmr4 n=1 Tax=Porphyromonas sp. TaxID=1924944 RepID=UPI0026DDB0E6|nr:type III-B CRISPR module RAMP protein Cmr4 [Porphyromonas sp.]MDO4770555.1 type III-B CRISPR module RAMP protein Cmr4 [Porphyromonas sp.]
MKTAIYTIRCLTNMHVGKGDATYEVVDNCVQRDVTTGFPCIYSSSLKGALRQYFSSKKFPHIRHVFGSDANNKDLSHSVGHFTFFQANLIGYPVRTEGGNETYILRTNNKLIKPIENLAKLLGVEDLFNQAKPNLTENENLLAELEQLPVIARNNLDNGESQNLWYEEVIPSEARFVFFVSYDDEEIFKEFDKILQESPVQIGANGSIGYGFCKIENIIKIQK